MSTTTANWHDHIVCDPAILGGKPILKGTRLSVEFVFSAASKTGRASNNNQRGGRFSLVLAKHAS